MRPLLNFLMPLFLICIVLSFFMLGMILLSYLFIFGLIIGLAFMIGNWVRKTFFITKAPQQPTQQHKGRIIDSDEWNQL